MGKFCQVLDLELLFFLIFKNYFNCGLITLQYCSGFCHTLTWISHGCTCVPHPFPQSSPSALALSALSHASNLDRPSVSHMIIDMFQCYSLKSSHPRLLPQSPNVCSLSLCLFCCLAYWVIISIFLNSIIYAFSSVQSLSHVRLFATPWIAARQASLSITRRMDKKAVVCIHNGILLSH